jgi:hypothetical protein
MAMEAKGEIKEVTISAVVIRADGTREDLGVIARMESPKKKPRPPWRTKKEERE